MDTLFKPGDVFKVKSASLFNNNQSYGIAVPILTPDGCYLLDTYMLKNECIPEQKQWDKTVNRLNSLASDPDKGKWALRYACGNYYNHNYVKLDSESIKEFYPWFNINDYMQVPEDEACMYDPSDTVNYVKLFWEHCYYTDGCTAVRKCAKKRDILVCHSKCNELHSNCRSMLTPSTNIKSSLLELRSQVEHLAQKYKSMDAGSFPDSDEHILVECAKLLRDCEICVYAAEYKSKEREKLRKESSTWSFNCLSNVDTW